MADVDELVRIYNESVTPSEHLTPDQVGRLEVYIHGGSPIGRTDDLPQILLLRRN